MNRRIIFGLLSLPAVFSIMSLPQAQAIPPPKQVELLDGAKWVCSTDGGKTFSPEPVTIKAETTVTVTARTEFEVADTTWLVVLELTHGLPPWKKPKFSLNGSEIKGPMKGMYYKTIPAIDAKLLKKGKNVLTAGITLKNKSTKRRKAKDYQLKIAMRLVALRTSHLQIQTGPILGAVGKDYFTITCRTNMPAVAEVSQSLPMCSNKKITMCKIVATSGLGLLHRFRIEKDNFIPNHEYGLSVQNWDISTLSRSFRSPQLADQGLRFVAMGDSRTFPKDWAKVTDAVLNAKPDLVAFSGDMVGDGRNDWEWDEHFCQPEAAKKLLATIPFYAVIGNHERNAPVYNELFYTPSKDGKNRNWSQTINGVLLIGIDGEQDFSAGSDNGKWLEKTLGDSKAKFIFLFNHYPAWSSSNHGRLDKKTGRPREKTVRQAQDILVPLLTKYKATAYICGHDHCYERSELPGGLTHIISGGAGAPLRKKTQNAEKQNPHSKVFHSVLHYCLFEIKGDTCTMKAVTPDGKTIDTRIWKARKTENAGDIEPGNIVRGMRGFTLRITQKRMPGNLLRVGSHVDVLGRVSIDGKAPKNYSLIQNLRVLAIGGRAKRTARMYRSVTVEVSPKLADEMSVLLARVQGDIQLVIRNPKAKVDFQGINPRVRSILTDSR